MGIFNDLRIALFDFRGYPKLLEKGKKHAIAFGVLIVTIFWIMVSVVPVVTFFVRTGGFSKIVETYVPEFTLQNGTLQAEQSYHFANGMMYIDVNTDPSNVLDPSSQKLRTILSLNDTVFVADSKRAIFKVTPIDGANRAQMIEFSSLEGMTITKDYLRQLAPVMNVMECIMCVVFFFVHLAGYFIYSWIIAFAGRIFARFFRMNLSTKEVFPLAVYARAFPVLVEGVFFLTGLIIAETAAVGMLYSMFVLSRVFRYMAMSGEYPGRSFEELRNRDAEYRNRDAGFRNPDAEYRNPDAEYRGSRRDEDRVPTPKTPDGGGVIPGYRNQAESPEYTGNQDADDDGTGSAESVSTESGSAESGSTEYGSAESGSGVKTEAVQKTPRSPEEPGKPVYQPDHTEVREALVKEDLKPSDGWSFGSSAAENTDIPKERESAEITDRNDEES